MIGNLIACSSPASISVRFLASHNLAGLLLPHHIPNFPCYLKFVGGRKKPNSWAKVLNKFKNAEKLISGSRRHGHNQQLSRPALFRRSLESPSPLSFHSLSLKRYLETWRRKNPWIGSFRKTLLAHNICTQGTASIFGNKFRLHLPHRCESPARLEATTRHGRLKAMPCATAG